MTQVIVSLPKSISKNDEMDIAAVNAQQLFMQIKLLDQNIFDLMFRIQDSNVLPKAFVSMFVNEEQTFDYHQLFNNGDRVVFGVAIAGG